MPRKLQKSLQDYLSKIKNPAPAIQLSAHTLSSSKNWILSGCKHTKTLSFAVDHNVSSDSRGGNNEAATLADIDRFLMENFRSLYVQDEEVQDEKKGEGGGNPGQSPPGILFESPRFLNPPPDLCGSSRFFVAPGLTGSLIEEARLSSTTSTSEDMGWSSTSTNTLKYENDSTDAKDDATLPNECIAVLTYSPNPYDDFRRSMQEIVDTRFQHHGKVDWDFMEELLFCYLNLNDKKSHKFILGAFVDVIVALRQIESKVQVRSRNLRIERERRRRRRAARHLT